MTATIKFHGIELVVEGDYYKGYPETHDYPGYSENFYPNNIYISSDTKENNIIDWLGYYLEEICELVLNQIE